MQNPIQNPIIVWFKNDLRIADNPALNVAVQTGQPIVAIYILDDETPCEWKMGGASRWWLHHSLTALNNELTQFGGKLILRTGKFSDVIDTLASEIDSKSIFWNRGYEPYIRIQEDLILKWLEKKKIEVNSFNGNLLLEPWEVFNKQGKYFKVFTQYWKTCLKILETPNPLPKPSKINFYQRVVASEKITDWNLLPTKPNWAKEFDSLWQPGEKHAHKRLKEFLDGAFADYDITRDLPAQVGTSQLSPYLHFGEISPKMIWHAIEERSRNDLPVTDAAENSKNRYMAELGWREFSNYLLYHFPKLPKQPFSDRFSNFPWRQDEVGLHAWQKGLTGYPIVDAGMRQLWHVGWMHNRVRMIVASFLTKDLMIPWQKGAMWFWDTLVDADLANNSASWQWVAGCGADAAPYFRIFNPVLQGEKFDPDGDYIRRWVPELRNLPNEYIHSPWEAPALLLKGWNVVLGDTYPWPIVDHSKARLDALAAFKDLRN